MRTDNQDDHGEFGGKTVPSGVPHWRVGFALFSLVILILAAGFYFSSRLRPPVDEDAVAAVTPRLQNAITKPTPEANLNTAPASSSPVAESATPAASPEAVVSQAYLHYWDIYSEALYTLDASRLDEVMSGDELNQARQIVDNLRAQHHAAKTVVQHHFAVVSLAQNQAVIQDEYLNRSYLIDATTKQALQTPTSGQTENISCQLSLQNGTWKVVKVTKINETITQ